MHITRSLIHHILKTKSIVEYLEKKGHFPVKHLTGGRLSYLCPLPWHSETKPSFVVWTNSEYENFYCFGCQATHNIIHLVSFLDSISARKAIEKLSDGVEFTIADDEKLVQADLIPHYLKIAGITGDGQIDAVLQLSKSMVDISNICNMFLESVDYDEKECERMDKLWAIIDKSLQDFDFEKIEKIQAEIGGLILKHKEALHHKETAELKNIYGGGKDA